jgi:hypothetical protein
MQTPGFRRVCWSRQAFPKSQRWIPAVGSFSLKNSFLGRYVFTVASVGIEPRSIQEHLHELEGPAEEEQAFYVIYPDSTSGDWRIQAVPLSSNSFESRKALPEPWRGLRDDDLSHVSGIPGGVFVHASGFIGGMNQSSRTHCSTSCDHREQDKGRCSSTGSSCCCHVKYYQSNCSSSATILSIYFIHPTKSWFVSFL